MRLAVLVSYTYERNPALLAYLGEAIDLLIDSGAFSNANAEVNRAAGKPTGPLVTVEEYTKFCKEIDGTVWGYVALDRIHDAQTTRENLDYMVQHGTRPIPVYTEYMTPDEVPNMLGIDRLNRICAAGAFRQTSGQFLSRLHAIYDASEQRARIHALALGRWPMFLTAPIYSVDTTTWHDGARYGILITFDVERGMHYYHHSKARREGLTMPNHVLAKLRAWNVHVSDITDPLQWQHHVRLPSLPFAASLVSYLQISALTERKGRHYFLVFSSFQPATMRHVVATISALGSCFAFDYQKYKARLTAILDVPVKRVYILLKRQAERLQEIDL